ncbi:MAG: MATE family efflux transporter [Anaerolineae bacterium]|nr:MATE family efflux transporter [Anaerolineae bacterium]
MTTTPKPLARQPLRPSRSWAPFVAELQPIISLAVPLVAGLTTSTIMGLVDTYMLGNSGAAVLGAVSLTSSVLLIFYAALYGFMGPAGILIGQAFGAAQADKIGLVVRHGLLIGTAAGAASTLLMLAGWRYILPLTGQPAEVMAVLPPYWITMSFALVPYCVLLVYKQLYDAIDRPWTGLLLTLVPVGINILLNRLLIAGGAGLPPLGIAGAGIASLIAQTLGAVIMMLHYHRSRLTAAYRRAAPWRLSAFREHLREGVPMSFQYLMEGGAVAVAGVLIGWLGTTALAANQIVYSVASVLYMLPLGMSGAVSIRVSQAAGGGEKSRIRAISYTALALVTLWTALFTLVLLFAGESIAGLFVDERPVIVAAAATFISVGLMQIFDGLQSVSLGALRGMLDNRYPTRISLIGYWLVALPAGYILSFHLHLGPAGFWGGFGIGLAVAALLLIRRLRGHFA